MAIEYGNSDIRNVPASEAGQGLVLDWQGAYPTNPNKENQGFSPGDQPPAEIFNYLFEQIYQDINFLKRAGVAPHNPNTSYLVGSIVVSGGALYVAVSDNVNNAPPSGAWQALALLSDVVPKTFIVRPGNGMLGGGTLNGTEIEIALGQPKTLSLTSTNNRDDNQHSHEISLPNASRTQRGLVTVIDALGYNRDAVPSQHILTQARDNLSQDLIDHTNSGDHDNRYYTKSNSDSRYYTKTDSDNRYKRKQTSSHSSNKVDFSDGHVVHKVLGTISPTVNLGQLSYVWLHKDNSYQYTIDPAKRGARLNGTWISTGAGLDGNDRFEYSFEKITNSSII